MYASKPLLSLLSLRSINICFGAWKLAGRGWVLVFAWLPNTKLRGSSMHARIICATSIDITIFGRSHVRVAVQRVRLPECWMQANKCITSVSQRAVTANINESRAHFSMAYNWNRKCPAIPIQTLKRHSSSSHFSTQQQLLLLLLAYAMDVSPFLLYEQMRESGVYAASSSFVCHLIVQQTVIAQCWAMRKGATAAICKWLRACCVLVEIENLRWHRIRYQQTSGHVKYLGLVYNIRRF